MCVKLKTVVFIILAILYVTSSWVVTIARQYVQGVRYILLGVPHDVTEHPNQRSVRNLGHFFGFSFVLGVVSFK